jgi:hypothetical protein
MLECGNLTIEQIAREVGYEDAAYFHIPRQVRKSAA